LAHRLKPLNNTVALCFGGKLRIGKKRKRKVAEQADKGEKMRKGVSKGEKEIFPLAAGGKLFSHKKYTAKSLTRRVFFAIIIESWQVRLRKPKIIYIKSMLT